MINQQDFKVMMTSNNTRLCKRFDGVPKAGKEMIYLHDKHSLNSWKLQIKQSCLNRSV